MDYFGPKKFKSILRAYCTEFGIAFPEYSERHRLHKAFNSTTKYPDNDIGVARFLDDNLTQPKPKVKEKVKSFPVKDYPMRTDCLVSFASLTQCVPQPCVSYECPKVCKEKEVEKTMSLEIETRNYLISRLNSAQNTKRSELQDMFNLYVNQNPRTYKELIDWIKNDKFKLDDKRTKQIDAYVADDDWYGNFTDGITFTGSGRPLDMDGYNAATKEMSKQFTAAKDAIMTSDATEGLKALQAFEAWVPTSQASASTSA